ncbi:DNA-binding CsgD family transcriptional regulator [Arthrobacter roseus]|nr:DNA-binding CsgD family transcriptional regulator [Arthrobacter roseus]
MRNSLEPSDGHGVLLTGTAGIGKSALARRVLQDLQDTAHVVHIRASASLHQTPLGALNLLRSHLDPRLAENPLLVVSALEGLLASTTEKPVILLVDNAEELDAMSASVLAQLACVPFVKLVVVCQSLSRAPQEFCGLWQDGQLTRIEVPPLTFDEMRQLLSIVLDARIAASAAHFLWSSSNGHPQYVQAMTQELIECGQLGPNAEGIWVMNGAHPDFGHRLASAVASRLRGYDPESRTVMELLALTGGLPLDCLPENTGQKALDVLQEDGLISFDRSEPAAARLTDREVARAVREAVPLGRKHSMLRSMLSHVCSLTTDDLLWQVEYVGWRLECGMAVPDERLVAAAAESNNRRDPVNALWFLQRVPTHRRHAAVVLEEAHAHVLLGDSAAAIHILDDAADCEASLSEWVHLELLRGTLLQRHQQRHVETQGILRSVQERLAGTRGGPVTDDLRACFAAVDIEHAGFEGRLQDMERAAAELTLPANGLDASWRLRAAAWQAEVAVLMGQQEVGLAKLNVVIERMLDARVDQSEWENAQAVVVNTLVLAGRWQEAAQDVRQWRTRHELPHSYSGIETDLAEGVLHVLAGRGGEALERLESVTSQLTTPDSSFFRARIEAATAYAHALQGNLSMATTHLRRAENTQGNPAWVEKQLFNYLYWMAVAAVEDTDRASHQLLNFADENADKAAGAFELMFLLAAVMLGRREEATRLAETAQRQQGAFARVAHTYAMALLNRSPRQLTEAAERALDMDFAPLALSATQTAREWAEPGDGRDIAKRTDRAFMRAEAIINNVNTTIDPLGVLTAGERRIADLAANGTPSKEIASILNLSSRTVDGYLNRTYSKLNLSGRTELRSVLG